MFLQLINVLLAVVPAIPQPGQLSFKSTSIDLHPADGISQIQPSGENIIAVGQHSYTVLTKDLKVLSTTEYPPLLRPRLRSLTDVVMTMENGWPVHGIEFPFAGAAAEVNLIDFAAKTRKAYFTAPTFERENLIEAGWAIPEGAAVMTTGNNKTSAFIIVGMDGQEKSRRMVPCLNDVDAISGPRTFGERRVLIYGTKSTVIAIDDHGAELARWSAPDKDDYVSVLHAGEEHNGALTSQVTISHHPDQFDWRWMYMGLELAAGPNGLEFEATEFPERDYWKLAARAAPQHITLDGARYGVNMRVASSRMPGGGVGAKVPTVRIFDADGNKVAEHLPVTGEPPFIGNSGVLWSDSSSPVFFVGWGATIYRIECSREAMAK